MKQFKFNERQRFSIRKFSIGAASVLLGSVFFAVCSVEDVQAAEQSQNVVSVNENKQTPNPLIPSNSSTTGVSTKKANTSVSVSNVENKLKGDVVGSSQNAQELEPVVSTISDSNERKLALSKLIEEIDGKFTNGKYASKTEESVNQLKAILEEARSVLSNATTESELTQAHSKLVTATTQLKTKQAEKKEAPEVDTTNGKPTVGKKATNTEKASDSNSIANSGSRDERHGKALNRSNPFRTDATTTNDDPSANQTYTAPAENASLTELIQKLKELAEHIENNDKIKNIDSIGATKHVEAGTVKEIDEFGGWKAVDGGKFAIARKTAEGVYPLETINSTLDDTVWLQEQAFDRRTEYTLLLSKSITRANRDEAAWDGSVYKPTGVASGVTKNVARYKGIEKTFTAYSTLDGSDVVVKFKPGYVGDSDGSKANYKVQVYSITGNQETLVYETTFDPSKDANDDKKIVTKATDGKNKVKIRISNTPNSTKIDGGVDHTTRVDFIGKSEAEKLMAKPENLPNGESGTFTSKLIALPKGADHYKVRISLADPNRTGMSYQAWDEKYSVPVTGLDFSISQDTSNVARSLLQRIYEKLKATESADKNGKTPQTIQDYETELEKVKTLLATPSARTADFKQALEEMLAKQLALKVDKTGLTDSKSLLDGLVNEDPTPGKTQDTAAAYNAAKQEAVKVIEVAKTVIDNENATVAQVREALATVNAKKQTLEAAKQALVEAATAEEKAKLKADADSLVKADTTGKTPNSIEAYNTKYEALKAQLEAAKAEAATVLAKENNASKAEAQAAQTKVDAAKAELTKAAGLLVNKADKTELTKAKEALSTLVSEEDPTTGKTADSAKSYNDVKTAAEEAIKAAETVINDENATQDQVTEALNKVNEKKAALEAAKQALVEAATTEEKTKLKADVDSLVKADITGKTPNSIAAYERKYEELKAQLEAAKEEAEKVLAKENNASKVEAQAAQAKVDAVKTELENAKNLLVEAATTEEKTKLKADVDSLVKADITGKTPNSIAAYERKYEELKAQLEAAKEEAEKVLAKENNASKVEAQAAQAKVDAVKTELENAKNLLVEAATTEEKTKLKADVDSLVKADITGKTPNSIAAYERKYEELKAQLEAAKTEAVTVLAKADNASKAEVQAAQTKVDAAKSELTKAAELLVNKADKAELTKAKEALNTLVTEADPTTGKTADSAKSYNDVKTVAEEAIKAAETVINDENATQDQVTEALNKVNEKKAALEAAKQALVEAATTEEKAKLKTDADSLVKADETGKTPESIAAYERKYEELKAQLEAAKTEAVTVLAKADNASKAEVQAAQTKVDAAKTALDKAAELLKDLDRDAAKKEIADAAKKATDAIEASTSLTPEQKAEEKAKVAKEAKDATDAIDNATTEEGINSAKDNGKLAIEKEAAITAINDEKAAKEQEIDNNSKLSDEEKVAAKAEVAKASTKAVEAITKAATQDAVDAVKVNGEAAIKAVNPVGKEKALEAIQTVAEAKLAEIDKNTSLSSEEKKVAKAEVAKAAIEAVEAIQKSETQEAVNDAQAKGEAAIKAVNPIGKEKAKAAVEAAAAEKIASIRANPNLSAEEKAKEIAEVERLKQEALNAIDKATTKAELEKALRTFLYQMDQESLVYERPSFDLEAFIQSSITGVVTVERGKAIIQADVISKLNLPENVTVISIELPDTNTLGDKFAKVILRLADGTEITVKVPVRVVALQSGESKPETSFPDYGINNVTTNTDVKVDKAELEGAIRQLDELIIKESAKLDAETAKEANDLLADAKKVFANADASQAEVDAMVKRIEDFMAKVAPATDHATPANDQAAQTSAVAPATTQAATDVSQIASAQANTRKVAKELPNTGTADSVVSMLAAATSAVLGLGLAGRRRKEDEEA